MNIKVQIKPQERIGVALKDVIKVNTATGTKVINANGLYDITEYKYADVFVNEQNLQEKDVIITENGTYEVLPDDDYFLTRIEVDVNVPVPEGYIIPEGVLDISENGEHNVNEYEKVNINVPIPEGYIIPEGTLAINTNGEHDVNSYKNVSISVPIPDGYIIPEGTINIENVGTYDITDYAEANFSVPTEIKEFIPTKEQQEYNPTDAYITSVKIQPIPDEYIVPKGKVNITNTEEIDVTQYASAQVVDENLKAENIAEGVEVLGITGTLKATGTDRLKNLLDYTKSCHYMFCYSNVTSFVGYLEYDDTENVIDMSYAFQYSSYLESLPKLNTNKVVDMSSMCELCRKLTTIEQIGTHSVTNMNSMFRGCNSLPKIDITHYNIYSDNYGSRWCEECYSLKAVIIRSFGNNYVLSSDAFNYCYHLLGTTNSQYNPTGAKDGYIYVPKDMVAILQNETNWSNYADQIKAIFNFEAFGNGVVFRGANNYKDEAILNAVPNDNSTFKAWYKGFVEDIYEYNTIKTSYEAPQITYPFQLNGDGYYQNTNQNQSDSFSKGHFNFNITNEDQKLRITYLQSSEMGYDYGVIGNIDEALSNDTDTSGYTTLINQSSSTPQEIIIDNIGVGSHFIEIKYRKDVSVDNGTDTLQVKVEVVGAKLVRKLNIDESPYSTEPEINVGVINEMTMEPLNLVAVFESDYEQPTQNGDELLVTQVYRSEQNENILEVE